MKGKKLKSRVGASLMSPIKRLLILTVLFILIAVLFYSVKLLNSKKTENFLKDVKIENLKTDILNESQKANELNKAKDKVATDEDYEELAREELGLIKKDEIVIKPR